MTTKKKKVKKSKFKFPNDVELYFEGIIQSIMIDEEGNLDDVVIKIDTRRSSFLEISTHFSTDPKYASYSEKLETDTESTFSVGYDNYLNSNLESFNKSGNGTFLNALSNQIGKATRIRFYGHFYELSPPDIKSNQSFIISRVQFFNN